MASEPRRTTADADRSPEAKAGRSPEALNDQAFLRYSRQLLLQDIGVEGKQRLQAATVLLAGLGRAGFTGRAISGGGRRRHAAAGG